MSTNTESPLRGGILSPENVKAFAPLAVLALALTLLAEKIGAHTIDLGIGEITLYPLIWGLVLGGAASLQTVRPLPLKIQQYATHMVEIAILLLAARLSFVVGQNVKVLLDAGPALLLQEVGHLFGTVLFSLPIAVMLKMGRSTVGACFSIDREGSFAMVADRYGADSDEYRGVLSMYVFGTLVGALYVTLLATLLASAGIFDPRALAMGAGVGSGSVMAASSAAIAAEYPAMSDQILALAAVSNLITTVLGLYVGMYVALPLAERFYRFLTRRESAPARTAPTGNQDSLQSVTAPSAKPPLAFSLTLTVAAMLASTLVFHGGFDARMLGGFALMVALVLVSLLLRKHLRLSPIIGLSTIGLLVACPWSPVADQVIDLLEPIEFLALTTPVLVLAGLGLGKDAPLLRRIGWRIVPVGLVSFAASFIASAAIAQVALGLG